MTDHRHTEEEEDDDDGTIEIALTEAQEFATKLAPESLEINVVKLLRSAACVKGGDRQPSDLEERARRGLSLVYMLLDAAKSGTGDAVERRDKVVNDNRGAVESMLDLDALSQVIALFAPIVAQRAICPIHLVSTLSIARQVVIDQSTVQQARDESDKSTSDTDPSPPVATGPMPPMPKMFS